MNLLALVAGKGQPREENGRERIGESVTEMKAGVRQ